ncbi:MAG: tyrosine-type recombinase/integrase [Nanoarchaeota archaeon]|nr:tyrosine-type recombinase/integrase [Nanoarchaeota archaeon]
MYAPELIRKEGLRRGLRPETIKTYITCINKFLKIYHLDPRAINKNDVQNYLDQLRTWGKSDSTINVNLNAIKFFYEKVLGKKLTINIAQARIRKRLPTFLTQDETKRLLDSIKNPKHQLMIKLLYATGMRVSELINLKIKDFEFNDNYGWVRDGKGGKDRLFILALKLKEELLDHLRINHLNDSDWLFCGNGNSHYTASSIRLIIKKATKIASINKNVHPHTLRHSFATHLIENGYAVTEVQPLLGHDSLETTMIYLHMASPDLMKVKSPYDQLEVKSK